MNTMAPEVTSMRPLRVAVTGASGCIGRALLTRLHALPGASPRVLMRANGNARDACANQEIVYGDLDDRRALTRLVRETDVVFHCAATMEKSDRRLSQRVNVDATENLLLAAKDAGVRRFVFVSSISVYAATRTRAGTITEATVPQRETLLNHYSRTKLEAERRLQTLAGNDIEYTIVRPTNVYGPYSRPWFSQWSAYLQRTRYVLGDIPIDVVHCDDVADALLRTGTSPAARNNVFHVGHESIRLNEFVERVAAVVQRPTNRIPAVLDRALRGLIENGYRMVTGHVMSLSLTRPTIYPHDKAARVLAYAPRVGLDAGFAALAQWYRGSAT